MLLSKRVATRKTEKEIKEKTLKGLVSLIDTEDRFFLDDENAIILIENNNREEHNEYYIIIHERLKNGKLEEINRWYMGSYYFGGIHDVTVIKELNLFKVQNGRGQFNALYDYKNDKFIVPRSTWEIVDSGRENKYLEKYNGFLATFSISSDYEKSDVYSYVNPVTDVEITKSFSVYDGNYYAILNTDGTIRGNKLFKGDSFSQIEEIIDLDKYESLDEFKKERKQRCNEIKASRKQKYQKMIEERNDGSISPYLDSEVAKIIKLQK